MADSQKYGRTANLFDVDNIHDAGNYYIDSFSQTIKGSSNTDMLLIPCNPNTNYTVSRGIILPRFQIGFLTTDQLYDGLPVSGDVIDASAYTLTSTSASDSRYLAVYYAKHGGSDSSTPEEIQSCLDTLMVNEGSTALPYEPYLDWQHSLRKLTTATEAIENPLYTDGTAITSYTIKGNTVQNGIPTPSNPVDVNGVGVRTEQLFDSQNGDFLKAYIRSTDGYVGVSGFATTVVIPCKPNTVYTSTNPKGNRHTLACFSSYPSTGDIAINFVSDATSDVLSITTDDNAKYLALFFNDSSGGSGESIDDVKKAIMLNTGSTAKPYEPYGYKIPISSGGVTTNIYLGSTQTVRQIYKIEYTGAADESWSIVNSGTAKAYVQNSDNPAAIQGVDKLICTHYEAGEIYNGNTNTGVLVVSNGGVRIRDTNAASMSVDSFKTYLQQQYANGTPVTLWYVLDTAETAVVNEPLMKIGTYADTLSNATAIPTTEGANTITVDTTVQPSEFTATWTGWHDAAVKEWNGSQWN